jgi:feruloyl esterase
LAKTQEFYRLFLAPGVGHCGGGPGPNEFGQGGGNGDAEHDLVTALERWVEQGVAPAHIIASKFHGDDPAKGVAMTRPLCPFPQVAKYVGSGNVADAKRFDCVAK